MTSTASPSSCSGPTVDLALRYFHVDAPEDLVASQLTKIQDLCSSGSCPTVAVPGCDPQSIDDVQCEIEKVFTTSVQFGADEVCAACSDWPCKLCKVACRGKESCLEKCDQCEIVFENCKETCRSKLTTEVSADFEHLSGAISSTRLIDVDLKCSGDGISQPLQFSADTEVAFGEMDGALKLHTRTAGKSVTYPLSLSRIRFSVAVPIDGDVQCDLLGEGNIDIRIGDVRVSGLNFDVDSMQTQLTSISAAACAALPICRGAAKNPISNAISAAIRAAAMKELPGQLGKLIKPMLQGLLDGATCAMFVPTNHTVTV